MITKWHIARHVLALLLCVALLAPTISCGTQTTAASVADGDVVTELARAGVPVYADFRAAQPVQPILGKPSALKLTQWQVYNMAREVDAHDGHPGAQYDAISRFPKKAPPFSFFVAAWIVGAHSEAARYAKRIMGKQNWKNAPGVIFPMLVMMLFVADATRSSSGIAQNPSGAKFDFARYLGEPAQAATPCSDISNWVSGVVTQVFDALKSSKTTFWASLWNGVLTLVKDTAFAAVQLGLGALLAPLKVGLGIIGAVGLLISVLRQWTAKIIADPSLNRFAIAPESPLPGRLIVLVDRGNTPAPDEVTACMDLAGGGFDVIKVDGAPVAWNRITGIPQYASQESRDNELQHTGTATLHYATRVEQPPGHCSTTASGAVSVDVRVLVIDNRQVWERMWSLIAGQVLGDVAGFIENALQPILLPEANSVRDAIFAFQNPRATGSVPITYHVALPNCTVPQNPNGNNPQPTPMPNCATLVTEADVSNLVGTQVTLLRQNYWTCDFFVSAKNGPVGVAVVMIIPPKTAAAYAQIGPHVRDTCSEGMEHANCYAAWFTRHGVWVMIGTGVNHPNDANLNFSPEDVGSSLVRIATSRL